MSFPAPSEILEPLIHKCYEMELTQPEILQYILTEIDKSKYGISLSTLKRRMKELGLYGTRQQNHTLETAVPVLQRIREKYPKAGLRDLKLHAFQQGKEKIKRAVIQDFFKTFEPDGIRQRKAKSFKRKIFWAAGVNDIWAVDQHDKWRRFGLYLHTGVEVFSGKILWAKVWWTNRNPRLILSYYLEIVNDLKAIPLVTQSDPGTENYGIANVQTILRHMYDHTLRETRQHRWMSEKSNIKPEISWSQMRRRFTPGFENILDTGVREGWYDTSEPIDLLLFRWLFIPWLQQEIDLWKVAHNNGRKRADKNKILPVGKPNHIFEKPELFGALDFKVGVDQRAIDQVRHQYIVGPNDPVFELVPPGFNDVATQVFRSVGCPEISHQTIWDIFVNMQKVLVDLFLKNRNKDILGATELTVQNPESVPEMYQIQLTEALQELAFGESTVSLDGLYYMGGLPTGHPEMENVESDMQEDIIEVGSSAKCRRKTPGDMEMTDTVHMQCVRFSDEEDESEIPDEW